MWVTVKVELTGRPIELNAYTRRLKPAINFKNVNEQIEFIPGAQASFNIKHSINHIYRSKEKNNFLIDAAKH